MLSSALAMLLQAAAQAAAPSRTAADIPSATQPLVRSRDPNEVLCRKETTTGHLIGTSVCRTRLEWQQIALAVTRRNDTTRTTGCIPPGVAGITSPSC